MDFLVRPTIPAEMYNMLPVKYILNNTIIETRLSF